MVETTNSATGKVTDIDIGTILYNWRYGPLTVEGIEEKYIYMDLLDRHGVVEIPEDSWNPYLYDNGKKYRLDDLGKYLFTAPDDVGMTLVEIDIADFEAKLHKSFDASKVLSKRS